ncbi:MAG: pyridoxal-phosphate dependent enzyme, partial [Candidatus Eremiobacteraeota bacterium]|nr:pyridoxal-phosphate dependent enzyme [Candidatus Eremiobacteraeota bacterium]
MLSWQRPAVSSGSAVELQQEPPWSRSDVHRTVPKPSLAADTRDIRAGFVGTIGDTPLIALPKLSAALGRTILGKAEYLNPGGSVKDRAARGIIEDFERRGLLAPGGTVVEGTAGNTGIGLALVGNARGYRTVIVMPDDQAPEKYALLRVYGAELHVVESAPFTNEEKNYYHVARRIAASIPGAVWANQFENTANRDAHERTTGPEIIAQCGGALDAFVAAAGTGGTLAGVGRALKAHDPRIRVALADPYGSALFSYVKTGELAT